MKCGSLEWLLEPQEDNNEQTDEIQGKSGVYLAVMHHCLFLRFSKYTVVT